ncbi:hypothetical protein LOTGIDRAFT_164855 [Lottia gigantea]|uniref:SOCS box domain-containing protein n=1 Tax=Lottia gigantea TaxID=225164 RepID=V3ZF83_LOTGI|nr:hypothetical protein LOTGIDRAFT_164855 [Lottia gigantea]ESO89818.1 hypothetical protein LOTGIDRAFT_164855 [Lottia gigantea]
MSRAAKASRLHFKKKKIKKMTVVEAIENGNCEQLQHCIVSGFDFNKTIKISHSEDQYWLALPFCLAIERHSANSKDIMELILKTGIDLDKRSSPIQMYEEEGGQIHYNHKNTYLHMAIKAKNMDAILLLIKYGADLNATNLFDTTPLQFAVSFQFWTAVDLLISHNAIKQTPSTYVIPGLLCWGQFELITKLVAAGYNIRLEIAELREDLKGCFFSQEELLFINNILDRAKSPDSLLQCCRKSIRQCLGSNCNTKAIDTLELPTDLADFLSLKLLWLRFSIL